MGADTGRRLFRWTVRTARDMRAREMIVEADPGAVPFYIAMGCRAAGRAPFETIPGLMLPRLMYDLRYAPQNPYEFCGAATSERRKVDRYVKQLRPVAAEGG